jgi:CheY-like chemotaxis protein
VQVYAAMVRKNFDGARVHTAVDLPEALQIAAGRPLDLVLLDLTLPSCSGIEALERFRGRFPASRCSSSRRAKNGIGRRPASRPALAAMSPRPAP